MTTHRLKSIALAAAVSVSVLASAPIHAAEKKAEEAAVPAAKPQPKKSNASVNSVLKVNKQRLTAAQKSQKKIDMIASETGTLLEDYKTVMKRVDGLRIYNARLEKQIANQLKRLDQLGVDIANATVIARQVDPLIERMIDSLEQFVELDVPFNIEERRERVAFLRKNLGRSDVTVAEKFRQVLEAYKIENEYGRKIEAYKGQAEVEGSMRDVNFFRVGRIALMYQTTDTEFTGAWDQSSRSWVELDKGEYRSAVLKGLRIARKQASIDILKVPVPAPEAAK